MFIFFINQIYNDAEDSIFSLLLLFLILRFILLFLCELSFLLIYGPITFIWPMHFVLGQIFPISILARPSEPRAVHEQLFLFLGIQILNNEEFDPTLVAIHSIKRTNDPTFSPNILIISNINQSSCTSIFESEFSLILLFLLFDCAIILLSLLKTLEFLLS